MLTSKQDAKQYHPIPGHEYFSAEAYNLMKTINPDATEKECHSLLILDCKISKMLPPGIYLNYEAVTKIIYNILLEKSFTQTLDIAFYSQIICTLSLEIYINESMQQLDKDSFLQAAKKGAAVNASFTIEKGLELVFGAWNSWETRIASDFFDNFEKTYQSLKDNPITRTKVKDLYKIAGKKLDNLHQALVSVNKAIHSFFEIYANHRIELLKLCSAQGISPEDLGKRFNQFYIGLMDYIKAHPKIQNLDLSVKLALKIQVELSRKKHQIFLATKKEISTAERIEIIEDVLAQEPSDAKQAIIPAPQISSSTPANLTAPTDNLWDISQFKQAFKQNKFSDLTLFINLSRACYRDDRVEITKFLLSKIKIKKHVHDKYKGLTPLEHAAKRNSLANIKALFNAVKYTKEYLESALTLTTHAKIKELINNELMLVNPQGTAVELETPTLTSSTIASSFVQSTTVTLDVTYYQNLISNFQAQLAELNTEINSLEFLANLNSEKLSSIKEYQDFCAGITTLKKRYQELASCAESLDKTINSEDDAVAPNILQNLTAELDKKSTFLRSYIDNNLRVLLERAKRQYDCLTPPAAPAKVNSQKPETKVSTPRRSSTAIIPSAEEYLPMPLISPPPKPKLAFPANTLFWQGERLHRRGRLRRFCEFNARSKDDKKPKDAKSSVSDLMILRRLQLLAIICKLKSYFEVQKHDDKLPPYTRDAITSQLGKDKIRTIRNSLVHAISLIYDTDENELIQRLENFKSFGLELSNAILSKDATAVEKHKLFVYLYNKGKPLCDKLPDANRQTYYLLKLSERYLHINSYTAKKLESENSYQAERFALVVMEMKDSALEMLRVIMAKFCKDLTAHDLRRQALATTHLTSSDSEGSDEDQSAYIEEQLRTSWSERPRSFSS